MSRGIDRERDVKRNLEARDYWVARAAGSLGDADLVALKAGKRPLLVEVKSTIHPYDHFGPKDRADLLFAASIAGADVVLAWWPSRGKLRWIPPDEWPGRRLSNRQLEGEAAA